MTDWGRSGRVDEFSFFEVDPFTLQETGRIFNTVDGEGSITWGTDTDTGCSGEIHFANDEAKDKMVRVKHSIRMPDGTEYGETLATLFIDSSSSDSKFGHVNRNASCYSSLLRISGDILSTDFSRSAGTVIVDEVRDLVEEAGGKLLVMPGVDEGRTHTVDVWFQIGENRSDVLKQIASWTNCELGVDSSGFITWSPYVEPSLRPLAYTFEEGSNCVYEAGFTASDEIPDAINRVVAHFSRQSKDEDDPYPLSDSVTLDLPDEHPYSFASIGRRKPYDLSVTEPCTHEELEAQASRKLYEDCGGSTYYQILHVGVPGLKSGDRVRYINSTDSDKPIDGFFIVEEISMSLKAGAPCSTKIRSIV